MKIFRAVFLFSALLLLTACNDPEETPGVPAVPEKISAVGSRSFSRHPGSSDEETLLVNEKFMTADDILQIFISPVSRLVWRIDLIIPQVPGGGDALAEVEKFISSHFNITFSPEHQAHLSETAVSVNRDYSYGIRAVRCSFTDLTNEKIFLAENDSPQAAELRNNRKIRQDIYILENAAREYHLDTGDYPESIDGLLKNDGRPGWHGPYLDTLPQAPQQKSYSYCKNGNSFEFSCSGNGSDL